MSWKWKSNERVNAESVSIAKDEISDFKRAISWFEDNYKHRVQKARLRYQVVDHNARQAGGLSTSELAHFSRCR